MDEDLKQYLRGMEERILLAIERTKNDLVSEIRSQVRQDTLSVVARKLGGADEDSSTESAGIEAGH